MSDQTQDTVEVTGIIATGAVQPTMSTEEKAAMHIEIKANFNNKVDVIETGFHFRKVVDADTKTESKRNSIILPLPVPSVEGIIDILQNGGK